MRDRREPWKWPVSIGLAIGLMLATVLWMPRSWLGFLLAPSDAAQWSALNEKRQWLTLLPPPVIESVAPNIVIPPDPQSPLPSALYQDPRWWENGWAVTATADESLFAPLAPAADDTLRLLLNELGLGADFMTQAEPDSLLAERLFLLQLENDFRYDELKPYLSQLARSKAYADILSRAADMYDEHLAQEIQVPD